MLCLNGMLPFRNILFWIVIIPYKKYDVLLMALNKIKVNMYHMVVTLVVTTKEGYMIHLPEMYRTSASKHHNVSNCVLP